MKISDFIKVNNIKWLQEEPSNELTDTVSVKRGPILIKTELRREFLGKKTPFGSQKISDLETLRG